MRGRQEWRKHGSEEVEREREQKREGRRERERAKEGGKDGERPACLSAASLKGPHGGDKSPLPEIGFTLQRSPWRCRRRPGKLGVG